jgi:membrane protease YdiL (CAAX protease family)
MRLRGLNIIVNHYLVRIIIGILVIGASVALIEFGGRFVLDKFQIPEDIKNLLIALSESGSSLYLYIILFHWYEKRQITELAKHEFIRYSLWGFATGFLLQTVFILFIYFTHSYSIEKINSLSFLLPAFSTSLSAGFVAEIIIRGIIFRLTEEKFGTITALTFITVLFAVFHLNAEGATPVSVLTSALMSGLFLSSVFVMTRSIWPTIFIHFGWDFTEPGIYGAINPGNSIQQSLFSSHIGGPDLITGGTLGPQNSLEALLVILTACIIIILLTARNYLINRRKVIAEE